MAHKSFVQKLIPILVKNGMIPEKEASNLEEAFKQSSKERFDYFLIDEGFIEPNDLLEALSELYEVPYFDVRDHFFERHLLNMFPREILRANAMIPLEVDENMLAMVVSEPDDTALPERIGEYVSYDVRFLVGLRRDIVDAIEEFYQKSATEVRPSIFNEDEEEFELDEHGDDFVILQDEDEEA